MFMSLEKTFLSIVIAVLSPSIVVLTVGLLLSFNDLSWVESLMFQYVVVDRVTWWHIAMTAIAVWLLQSVTLSYRPTQSSPEN